MKDLSNIYISAKPNFDYIEDQLRPREYCAGGITSGAIQTSAFVAGEKIIPARGLRQNDHYLDALRYLNFGRTK